MAGTTTLSPYKQLQAILMPSPEVDRAAYDRLQNPTEPEDVRLRELSSTYKNLLEEGSYQKIHDFVLNTAAELSNNPTYEQFHIRPDDVQADFVKEAGLSAQQNPPSPTPAEPQPQPGVLANFVKGFTDQETTPTGGGGSPVNNQPTAGDLIESLQGQSLMREFDDAVARGDENKINELMKQSLDLGGEGGILRKQFEIAAGHINSLTPDQWQKYGINRDQLLTRLQQATRDKEALLEKKQRQPESEKTESEKAAHRREQEREAELERQKAGALASGDINKKRQAYQTFVQHRLAQSRGYSVFVNVGGEDYEDVLPILQEILMRSYQARAQQRARQEQEEAEQEEEQQEEQQARSQGTQRGQQASQGFVRNLVAGKRGKGAQKKIADKLLHSKALDAAAKAAGPEAVVGLWILRHWKLVLGVAAVILILIVSVFIAIIVGIVSVFSGSTQGPPAQLGPTCNPSNTCVAALKSIGITVSGDLAFYKDPYGKAKIAYDTLSFISQSPSKYLQLLHTDKSPIFLQFAGGGCAGHASTNGNVTLYGFGSCGTDVAKFMLIHELGHEIAFRNPNLYNKFYNEFPLPVLVFYKLPTYNCELDYGPHGPFPGECFADTLGEYVMYKTYRNTVSGLPIYFEHAFTSFPTAFAPFYKFARDNVYNGLQF